VSSQHIPMPQYLIRDNESYEPLAMFPAPDSVAASLIMRKNFAGKQVHCLNIDHWTNKQKEVALVEIVSNCPTAQLQHFPS